MTQEKSQSNELVERQSRTRKLAYAPEFKKEITLSPGAIKRFLSWRPELKKVGDRKEEEGFSIEVVGSNPSRGRFFYKVIANKTAYFIKATEEDASGSAIAEMKSLLTLKNLIEKNKIAGVDVVNPKMSFHDKQMAYFISEWQDFLKKNLRQYLEELSNQAVSGDLYNNLMTRYKVIRENFGRLFVDLYKSNMAYDPASDKIYIFDVFSLQVSL